MRQYSNFLLFEGILDGLPGYSIPVNSLVNTLSTPSVRIVSANCGTLLGEPNATSPVLEGLIETATGVAFTSTRINTLLAAGTYRTYTRSVHTCTAAEGVCQLCYSSSYPYNTTPVVGAEVILSPTFIGAVDIIVGDGVTTSFQLTQTQFTPSRIALFRDGTIVASGFSVDVATRILTFTVAPTPGVQYAAKQYKTTTDGLLGYFSKTYSSALFGIKELPTVPMVLPENKLDLLLEDNSLAMAFNELRTLQIPQSMLEYYSKISSKVERALFIVYMYVLYVSVI